MTGVWHKGRGPATIRGFREATRAPEQPENVLDRHYGVKLCCAVWSKGGTILEGIGADDSRGLSTVPGFSVR
jgi:hypothetical protein